MVDRKSAAFPIHVHVLKLNAIVYILFLVGYGVCFILFFEMGSPSVA